jgi:hypothetical protein
MRRLLIALNVLLGPLVLASYVWGARTYPEQIEPLWGGVPEAARTAYTANMFFAAAGYLVFSWLLVLRTDLHAARFLGGRVGAGALVAAYGAILAGSIVWMPLTLHALDARRAELVPWIGLDLWVVAAGSLLVLACIATLAPREHPRARLAALVGAVFFCLQTVVLDASVWMLYFTVPTA